MVRVVFCLWLFHYVACCISPHIATSSSLIAPCSDEASGQLLDALLQAATRTPTDIATQLTDMAEDHTRDAADARTERAQLLQQARELAGLAAAYANRRRSLDHCQARALAASLQQELTWAACDNDTQLQELDAQAACLALDVGQSKSKPALSRECHASSAADLHSSPQTCGGAAATTASSWSGDNNAEYSCWRDEPKDKGAGDSGRAEHGSSDCDGDSPAAQHTAVSTKTAQAAALSAFRPVVAGRNTPLVTVQDVDEQQQLSALLACHPLAPPQLVAQVRQAWAQATGRARRAAGATEATRCTAHGSKEHTVQRVECGQHGVWLAVCSADA